jgi:hypothetical protein
MKKNLHLEELYFSLNKTCKSEMNVLVEKVMECQPNGKNNNSLLFYEFFIFLNPPLVCWPQPVFPIFKC